MKECPYCGKQFPDDTLVCPVDQQPLEAAAELRRKYPRGVRCPACGAPDDYSRTVELRGSFSWPVFFAGGLLAVLFRNAGRRRKVRCNQCQAVFHVRTFLSKVSLVIFWLLICPAIVALITLLVTLVRSIFSH